MPIAIFDDSYYLAYYRAGTAKRNGTQEKIINSKILTLHFFEISKFVPFLIKFLPISNQITLYAFKLKTYS